MQCNSGNYFLFGTSPSPPPPAMERKRDNVLLLSYEQTLSFAAHQLSQCGALISASNQDSECERAIVKNLRATLKLMRPMSLVGQEDAARALDKLEPLRLGAKAREGAGVAARMVLLRRRREKCEDVTAWERERW